MSASSLSADSVLERAPSFGLEVHSAGDAVATVDGVSFAVGAHALSLLAAFREPRPLREVLTTLSVAGARDFADLFAAVQALVGNGLLRLAGSEGHVADPRGQWVDPRTHVAMLDDTARTNGFLSAIREVVRPGDVVLDIGTGTGVLAIAAANAGARRVFAVEASHMAVTAARMCERNGVADRVEVVRGWSTRVTLPEPANVLVTETLGSDPLEEHIVDLVLDAQHRLLAPGAVVIPRSLRIFAAAVEVPSALLDRLSFTEANAARWSRELGLDFSALPPTSRGFARCQLSQSDAHSLIALGPPLELWHLELAQPTSTHSSVGRMRIDRDGTLTGIHVHFEADLADGITLVSHAALGLPSSHWQTTLWRGDAREVTRGEMIELRFDFDGAKSTLALRQ